MRHFATVVGLTMIIATSRLASSTLANEDHPPVQNQSMVKTDTFGVLPDGRAVTQHRLTNANGISVVIINYGGIINEVKTPDREGHFDNITLGFEAIGGYLDSDPYFGALIGRYGNRIAEGKFTLDGQEYTLATNNGPNHLHGGEVGFSDRLWTSEAKMTPEGGTVRLEYVSPAGEEGYPGELTTIVTYTLTDENELIIDYTATTTAPTPVNLTNHAYWNLSGEGEGTILDHRLTLYCDKYLPVDKTLIPTGELAPVVGTPMGFTEPHTIGERIKQVGGDPVGYDHCYVVNGEPGELRPAAKVVDPETGRVLEVKTTEPGIQFYSGNFLNGTKANGNYPQYGAFCLEAQTFPNSPNEPSFPDSILRPGEVYRQTTVYQFSVADEAETPSPKAESADN